VLVHMNCQKSRACLGVESRADGSAAGRRPATTEDNVKFAKKMS